MTEEHSNTLRIALEGALENAKVPAKVHLGVLKALHDRILQHDADNESHRKMMLAVAQHLKKSHDQLDSHQADVTHLRSLVKGEKGEKGERGMSVPGLQGKNGRDGRNGRSVDVERVISEILRRIPKPRDGKDAVASRIDVQELSKEIISYIKTNKLLDLSHIKGASDYVMQTSQKNVRIKFEELMHGGQSSTRGVSIYTPTGTVNASNTVFGVTAEPSYVISDGITYFEGFGYSYAAGNITLVIAPSQYIRYAL